MKPLSNTVCRRTGEENPDWAARRADRMHEDHAARLDRQDRARTEQHTARKERRRNKGANHG